MKKVVVTLSIFTLLMAVSSSAAFAHKLAVNVPFDFFVGDGAMPAGQYVIDVSRAVGTGVIVVANARPGKSALVSTIQGDRAKQIDKTQLVFHRYGKTYFLAEVWDSVLSGKRQLRKSRTETEMARIYQTPPEKLALVIASNR
jgi:hypothetical protein